MDYILHPRRSFRAWINRRRGTCVVKTNKPRMIIIGSTLPNEAGDPNFQTYVAFFGVPYAQPPVESLRFKPPVPLEDTRHPRVVKAFNTHHTCIQLVDIEGYCGKEDCLYLNIYLPTRPELITTKLPVLVYIHGGGYEHGSGDIAYVRPDAIIRQNVVFVTINYRLNIFGFLNLGTEDCRGNAGLKDQVLALRWIKDNIDRFGGNPDNVTISGHSAGASCVNLHLISPRSKGLFHKAIVQSGGIYCPFGFVGNQEKIKLLFSKVMKTDAVSLLVKRLKKESARELLYITQEINENLIKLAPKRLLISMGPTTEPIEKDAFIPYDIERLMEEAEPVPLMAGICEGEGYMHIIERADDEYLDGIKAFVEDEFEFSQFLMENFSWSQKSARNQLNRIRDLLYFRWRSFLREEEIASNFAVLITDIWFRRFYDNFKIGKDPKPFYVYKFCYLASNNRLRQTLDPNLKYSVMAPVHGDDLNYLYNPQFLKKLGRGEILGDCRHVMNDMCKLWAKFCQMGDFETAIFYENVEWKPHTETEPRYLRIAETLTVMMKHLDEGRWPTLNDIVNSEPRVESSPVTPQSHHRIFKLGQRRTNESFLGIFRTISRFIFWSRSTPSSPRS